MGIKIDLKDLGIVQYDKEVTDKAVDEVLVAVKERLGK